MHSTLEQSIAFGLSGDSHNTPGHPALSIAASLSAPTALVPPLARPPALESSTHHDTFRVGCSTPSRNLLELVLLTWTLDAVAVTGGRVAQPEEHPVLEVLVAESMLVEERDVGREALLGRLPASVGAGEAE